MTLSCFSSEQVSLGSPLPEWLGREENLVFPDQECFERECWSRYTRYESAGIIRSGKVAPGTDAVKKERGELDLLTLDNRPPRVVDEDDSEDHIHQVAPLTENWNLPALVDQPLAPIQEPVHYGEQDMPDDVSEAVHYGEEDMPGDVLEPERQEERGPPLDTFSELGDKHGVSVAGSISGWSYFSRVQGNLLGAGSLGIRGGSVVSLNRSRHPEDPFGMESASNIGASSQQGAGFGSLLNSTAVQNGGLAGSSFNFSLKPFGASLSNFTAVQKEGLAGSQQGRALGGSVAGSFNFSLNSASNLGTPSQREGVPGSLPNLISFQNTGLLGRQHAGVPGGSLQGSLRSMLSSTKGRGSRGGTFSMNASQAQPCSEDGHGFKIPRLTTGSFLGRQSLGLAGSRSAADGLTEFFTRSGPGLLRTPTQSLSEGLGSSSGLYTNNGIREDAVDKVRSWIASTSRHVGGEGGGSA